MYVIVIYTYHTHALWNINMNTRTHTFTHVQHTIHSNIYILTYSHTHISCTRTHSLTQGGGSSQASRGGRENTKSILENMPELWDEELYKSEYDLSNFMQSLATSNKN